MIEKKIRTPKRVSLDCDLLRCAGQVCNDQDDRARTEARRRDGDPGVGYRFFVFKQKTAYEIPLFDWSSDVCSSDRSEEHTSYFNSHNAILYAVFCLSSDLFSS